MSRRGEALVAGRNFWGVKVRVEVLPLARSTGMESLSDKCKSTVTNEAEPASLIPAPGFDPALAAPLLESVATYAAASISQNTRKAYRSAWKRFEAFCAGLGVDPIPASPQLVCLYISHRADSGRKVSTIVSDLAAIAAAHKAARLASPTRSVEVGTVLAGIKRTVGTAPKQKRAVRINDLRRMVATLDDKSIRGVRDRLVLVLAFAGGFRRSEVVALNVEDIVEVEHGLRVEVRRSKVDQEGAGFVKPVPWGSSVNTCPVRCYRRWREASGITEGPVFRVVLNGDRLAHVRMAVRN